MMLFADSFKLTEKLIPVLKTLVSDPYWNVNIYIFIIFIDYQLYVQYLTLLSLHTITVLPLTTVYFVSEVHCTLNVLHSITP